MLRSCVARAARSHKARHGLQSAVASARAALARSRVQHFSASHVGALSYTRGLSTEAAGPAKEKHGFKAETSKLLDIVTNSIYTDKEIFLRELVSNAADALEKFRHMQASGETVEEEGRELEIRIFIDKEKGILTLEDTGVGMSKAEMMDNLGTIARSGSKAFVEAQAKGADVAKNVIGQFGVGFYSAFMVGKEVEVFSRSAVGGVAHVWRSTGTDDFEISEAPEFTGPGSRIVIHLKDDAVAEYTDPTNVEAIIKRYSNYVGFPVLVDGKKANEVSAIWAREKSSITDAEYAEFYRFNARAFDDPLYKLHFVTDVPIDLKALLFIPTTHSEKPGQGRMKPGVTLYSRRVLLEQNTNKLLPEWMRFVKGVVDSEDLPISLSRETLQDSRLLNNIKRVLTRRVIKLLSDEAKRDPAAYNKQFALEFGNFVKEGVCTDFENQDDVAKLLRFASNQSSKGELTSLDEYISRCEPSQDKIYYLSAPSRELAEASPYYEMFKNTNIEVLFLYNTMDDFVMNNLQKYQGRELVAAESGEVSLPAGTKETKSSEEAGDKKEGDKGEADLAPLADEEATAVREWLATELSDVLREVSPSTRLRSSPAILVDHESAALRRMMQMVQQGKEGEHDALPLPKQHLEINIGHPIIRAINDLRKTDAKLASLVARQVFDNAVIAAGLADDPRSMLPRLTTLLEQLVSKASK